MEDLLHVARLTIRRLIEDSVGAGPDRDRWLQWVSQVSPENPIPSPLPSRPRGSRCPLVPEASWVRFRRPVSLGQDLAPTVIRPLRKPLALAGRRVTQSETVPNPFHLLADPTAAHLHHLTERPPAAMYLNVEQCTKPARETSLSQLRINRAFAGKQRHSNLSFENKTLVVTILAGKNTGRAGVEPISHLAARGVQATNLERTLMLHNPRPPCRRDE